MSNINILAKEGYKSIILAFIAALFFDLIVGCEFMAVLLYILTIAFVFIYRNPERDIQSSQVEFLAPIDGKINSIDVKDGKKYIYIDVSLMDVHLLRSPIDGDFKIESYVKGLNLPSYKYKAKHLNERAILDFGKFKLNILSGLFNRKLSFKNKKLSKGERIGVFLDGRISLEFASDVKIFANIGDKVKAGKSILGAFNQ